MNDSGADSAEALDPRVQIELEQLNSATDEINRLEVELDEARLAFRRILAEGHLRFQQLNKKFGTSVHKARPYYEARYRANIISQELQAAHLAYDKANSAHTAAREMVYLAEQGLARLSAEARGEGAGGAGGAGDPAAGVPLDPAWQEMLNHATARVNQAEEERGAAAAAVRARAPAERAATALVGHLHADLRRHITKSRPYFEEKARINSSLEAQKARITDLERQVVGSKQRYAAALRSLETISDEIHRCRRRSEARRARGSLCNGQTGDVPPPTPSPAGESPLSPDVTSRGSSVRAWLRSVDAPGENWTEIDLEYSSPEEVGFDKCPPSLAAPRSPPRVSRSPPRVSRSPPRVSRSPPRVSRSSPRRYIGRLETRADTPRRPSLDALLYDTGEKVKEMFQGFSLFGERRGSDSAPRSPRASRPRSPRTPHTPRTPRSNASDETHSDTDSLASVEMLTDDQIASLMLDAQLEAVCERLVGIGVSRHATSPHENGSAT